MRCDKNVSDYLMVKIAGNDRSAFEKLYEKFKCPVFGLALAILKDYFDAEDAMQNVFVRVWDSAPKYRPGTNAGAWIMKITRNISMDKLRQNRDMTDIMEVADVVPDRDRISPTLDKLLLNRMFAVLNCNERQIIMLYIVGGYSHKEIAHIIGKPYATVRWQYANAIKKLQKALDKEDFYGLETQYSADP